MKCKHGKRLGYLALFEDAERRVERGERQVKCKCGLWVWPKKVRSSGERK